MGERAVLRDSVSSLPLRPPRPPSLQPSQHPAAPAGQRPWPAASWPGSGMEAVVTGRPVETAGAVWPWRRLRSGREPPPRPFAPPPAPRTTDHSAATTWGRGRAPWHRGCFVSEDTSPPPRPLPGRKPFSDVTGGRAAASELPCPVGSGRRPLSLTPSGSGPRMVSQALSLVLASCGEQSPQ